MELKETRANRLDRQISKSATLPSRRISQEIATITQIPPKRAVPVAVTPFTHARSKSHGSSLIRPRTVSFHDDLVDNIFENHRPSLPRIEDSVLNDLSDSPDNSSGSRRASQHGTGHMRQPSNTYSQFTIRSHKFTWRDLCWWRNNRASKYSSMRTIVPNHQVTHGSKNPNRRYPGNEIRTTKYTLLSFIPKNLLEQFKRFANVFFIGMVLLNWVLDVFGKELRAVPVVFVLAVTAIKDLWEDSRRFRSDRQVNNSPCQVYKTHSNGYIKIPWKKLRVGDMVRLSRNEVIPADIVVFRTSDPNGLCYIETSNLDGESNLKQREVVRGFKEKQTAFKPSRFNSEIEAALPTTKMFSFTASVSHPESGKRVPLTKDNLLLRGCTLVNTDYVEGVVVYAGHETKAMLNNGGPRHKRSLLEHDMNLQILWCLVIMAALCVIGITGSIIWNMAFHEQTPFRPMDSSLSQSFFDDIVLTFLLFLLLLQGLIPLPLYVTIEVAKLVQIFHIENDIDLYDSQTEERIACRSTNITEDLGQIQYIFSDKTGTLTENKMIFRSCTLGGANYNHASEQVNSNLEIKPNPELMEMLERPRPNFNQHGANVSSFHHFASQDFFTILALCNTVVVANPIQPAMAGDSVYGIASRKDHPVFQAESPDELALVEAAYIYEYKLVERTPDYVRLEIFQDTIEYEVLHIFPFDSVRKRMSTILQHPTTGQIVLYCKGADSAIFPQLRRSKSTKEEDLKSKTQTMIDSYAREGLRTLVVSKRILSQSEYEEWLFTYRRAELDFGDREESLLTAYEQMERNLELVGGTGIEDRLQDGVPHTIQALHEAGIMIWVLTGDKRETAINIAYSCKLFSQTMEIINLIATSHREAEALHDLLNLQSATFQAPTLNQDMTNNNARSSEYLTSISSKNQKALVVDGETLRFIFNPNLKLLEPFLKLACRCSAVLCCRATPLQKAHIVRSIKNFMKVRTLAIGDGNNDVSMIQTADVGVGISSGKEGMQAVMASDFAISKFRYLERLLLVHGNWCYDRLERMMLYFFYKNIVFGFLMFWFQVINGWSGHVSIDQMYQLTFSLLFTSLPPFVIGIYDQFAPDKRLMDNPHLYRQSRKRRLYKNWSFWFNMLDSVYQSAVIFFIPYLVYQDRDFGNAEFGTTVFVSCLYVMLAHISLELMSWTIIHLISTTVSLGAFYIIAFVYNSIPEAKLDYESPHMILHKLCVTPTHWLVVLVTVILALFPRFVFRVVTNTFYNPSTPTQLKHSVASKG